MASVDDLTKCLYAPHDNLRQMKADRNILQGEWTMKRVFTDHEACVAFAINMAFDYPYFENVLDMVAI